MKKNYTSKIVGKVIILFLFCIFLFSSTTFAQLNGTYTIGTNGTEDYTSFTNAVTALTTSGISGSVVFNVSAGDYNEQISIPEITGASETDTIVFQSESGNNADVKLFLEPTGSSDNFTINLNGVDFISFKDLTITSEGTSDFGTVITINNNVEHVNFIGNHFIGKTGAIATYTDKTMIRGDLGSTDNHMVFYNNVFDNCEEAMRYEHPEYFIFKENTVVNDDSNKGLYLNDLKNGLVVDNAITGTLSLYFMYGTTPVEVYNNIVKGYIMLYEVGMVSDSYPLLVYNNFLRGGINVRNSKYANIYNNTVYSNSYYPFYVYSSSSEIEILNNIFYADNSLYPAIFIEDIVSIVTLDYNDLYAVGTKLVTSNSVDYVTLTDWQTASSMSTNSYNQDLIFVDEVNTDLHIADGNPNLYGTPISGISSDIDGELRHNTNPNIGADEYSSDPMSGTFTITQGGLGDYHHFSDAITDLIIRGISGHCTFNVSPGTYTEQLIIPEITGAGEDAYITFQSASGNTEDVILTYTVIDPLSNFVLKLDGADYIYLNKLTFQKGTDATYGGRLLQFDNGANYNIIQNCNFIGYETGSSVNNHALIYSQFDNSIDEYNDIVSNTFTNGSMGIYFSGIYNSGLPVYEKHNIIRYNEFSEQYAAAISLSYQDSCIINNDSIYTTSTATTPYGIYLNECKKERVYLNTISRYSTEGDGSYGIYLEDCPGSSTDYGMIYNNFIRLYSTGAINTNGITLKNATNRNVYFNTVQIYGTNTGSQTFRVWNTSEWYDAKNNIFSNEAGGYAIYSDLQTNFSSNYNNLYSTGAVLAQHYATSCANLSEYQSASSKDGNSVSVDPQFISETNLHIYHANSDLNNSGTPIVLVTRDYDNELRDASHPDIGADEYVFISNQNDFLTYSFTEQTGAAIINTENHTISIEVENGTNLTSLVATFSISENASVKIGSTNQVSGVTANDFSSPVNYTITAEDDTEQIWTVTITGALNDENDILTFSFTEQTEEADINAVEHTVDIEVEFGTDLTDLIATFTLSSEATAQIGLTEQVSGVTSNNFSEDVVYAIYAENGTTQNWTVTVSIAQNSENDILSFSFPEQNGAATINATDHNVQIELLPGSSLSSLVATFTLSENAQAYIDETLQTSGTTANDFSAAVMYNVIAEDNSEQIWFVYVTVEPYHGCDILTFSFAEQTSDAVINTENHTVDIEVTEGTGLTNLVATFTLSEGATVKMDGDFQTSGTSENDFTEGVTYVVVAEDGINETEWTVNVTVENNSTGIEDLENLELRIFPNPATNYINVKSNMVQNDHVSLEIIDITGKIKSSKQIYLNNNLNVTLYFDDEITSGIYFLRVKTDSRTITQQFIVK